MCQRNKRITELSGLLRSDGPGYMSEIVAGGDGVEHY